MVAAWIRADTGVGPAMASGSHACRGNCADFPMAPPNRRRAATVRVPVPMAPVAALCEMAGLFAVPDAMVSPELPKGSGVLAAVVVVNVLIGAYALSFTSHQ